MLLCYCEGETHSFPLLDFCSSSEYLTRVKLVFIIPGSFFYSKNKAIAKFNSTCDKHCITDLGMVLWSRLRLSDKIFSASKL